MISENTYRTSFSPTLPTIQEEKTAIYYSHKSKRNKKRYKRNLKRVQRSYFKEATENKNWETDQFLDDIYDWYFA